ncbi:hypothetical protein [Labrenzia sp. DG1229]|uniref:hypothetical protein n=1 Tax=Labrenzia sp. DG1229 TaxID=681847 RepID=UPI0012EBA2B9|nr:hypothetical protein [Labrenzia sp. DG1229]
MHLKRPLLIVFLILLCVLAVFVGYQFTQQHFGYATHSYKDSCLSYRISKVEVPRGQNISAQTGPYFWITAPISGSARKSMDEPGIFVQFRKNNSGVRNRFLMEVGEIRRGCQIKASNFGLVERFDQEQTSCSLSPGYRYFEAKDKSEQDSAVAISCSTNSKILNCSMRYYMANDWTALITLPKEDLGNWKVASGSSRRFFSENLKDCGVNE